MATRLSAGIPLASLPLIAAVPAFEADNIGLAWGFVGGFFLILLGVFANRLPQLHRAPLIGAPKLAAEFELNGSSQLRARLLTNEEGASALLLVRIRTPRYADLSSAWINFVLPRGIRIGRVDAYGVPEHGGDWLQPTKHRLGDHEWADRWTDRLALSADLAHELWFKLYFKEPGTYPLLLNINDSTLYREFQADGSIEIDQGDELQVRDELVRLIDAAEAMLRDEGSAFADFEPSTGDLMHSLVRAHVIVPDDVVPFLKEAPSDPQDITTQAALRSHLRGLYDAQRALP